jgi:hypothetical protein
LCHSAVINWLLLTTSVCKVRVSLDIGMAFLGLGGLMAGDEAGPGRRNLLHSAKIKLLDV